MAHKLTQPLDALSGDDAGSVEIDDLIDHLARLTASDIGAAEFHAVLLDHAVRGLAAVAGAVWLRDPSASAGRLRLEYQINLAKTHLNERPADLGRHALLMERVLHEGRPLAVPPASGPPADGQAGNPTEFLLVIAPMQAEGETIGAVEVFQRSGAAPSTERGYVDFLAALAELAGDFHRGLRLRELREQESVWGQALQFADRVHASRELVPTAYAIANEGVRLVGCDRLGVGVLRGSKFELLACSGVDVLDRRANAVQKLERVVAAAAVIDRPLWHADRTDGLPPQVEGALQAYLDESHTRLLGIVFLKPPVLDKAQGDAPESVGALIVEQFDVGRTQQSLAPRVDLIAGPSAGALANCLAWQALPLRRLSQGLAGLSWFVKARQLPKTSLALAAAALAAIFLAVMPADFEVESPGEMQPVRRRDVFARSDGVVDELLTEHGKHVTAGQVLVVLRKPQLDWEMSKVAGEIQTTQKRLAAVEASRLGNVGDERGNSTQRYHELTAEEEELREWLSGLLKQQEVLASQGNDLQAKSPIDGEVITWNLQQRLRARPVTRGQTLLRVADVAGPWELELKVPEDRSGHLLAARGSNEHLPVTFLLESDPGTVHRGRVKEVAASTDLDERNGAYLLVTVEIDPGALQALGAIKPAATARARIRCGRKPLGYVWFHELFEFVQSRIFF